jgi:hypothetical protein
MDIPPPPVLVRKSARHSAPHRRGAPLAVILVLLAATAALAAPGIRVPPAWQAVALAAIACAVIPMLWGRRRVGGPTEAAKAGRGRYAAQLFMHLVPVMLLSLAFPVATARIMGEAVGPVPLTTLLLASSLTVPWLSQIVCMPLFEGVWDYTAVNDMRGLARRLLASWPVSFLLAVPTTAIFAIPVMLTMGWSLRSLSCFLILAVLHVVFAQSLVYSIAAKKASAWALGWTIYAAVFVLTPAQWYLPALAGIASQTAVLVFVARHWPRPVRVSGALRSLGKGALLGSLLWCDKFIYFIRWHDDFDAGLIFAAMLPAIIAYNFYFVVDAPRIDLLVGHLRGAMEDEPLRKLRERSAALRAHIESSAGRAALLAAFLGFGSMVVLGTQNPGSAALLAAIILASWCFVLASLLCYNLAYIGRSALAHIYGAGHILLTAAAFLAPSPTIAYAGVGLIEAICLAFLVRACFHEWRTPEYSLFWKHATRW